VPEAVAITGRPIVEPWLQFLPVGNRRNIQLNCLCFSDKQFAAPKVNAFNKQVYNLKI
jgi:hypothetical protein